MGWLAEPVAVRVSLDGEGVPEGNRVGRADDLQRERDLGRGEGAVVAVGGTGGVGGEDAVVVGGAGLKAGDVLTDLDRRGAL